jgi:antitoxin FitA
LRAYIHDLLEAEAARTPKADVLAAMREALARDPGPGITRESIFTDLEAERR